MFAGIVEESARIVSLDKSSPPYRLVVESGLDHAGTKIGDSIAINGCCLTVVEKKDSHLSFDIAMETARRTSLGELSPDSAVNLERSLRVGERLHGHFVSGHVDTTSELLKSEDDGNCRRLSFSMPREYAGYIATKGSIALAGISLTVGEVDSDSFAVYIVPHTEEVTVFSELKVGDRVNVEIDMIARYVQSLLANN